MTDGHDLINAQPGISGGLTKREYFAGLAMQGLGHAMVHDGVYSLNARNIGEDTNDAKWIATSAVRYADALLDALNKDEDK